MSDLVSLNLDAFAEARQILEPVITKTPLVYSRHYTRLTGNQVYFQAGKPAADWCVQGARCICQDCPPAG
jgi:hypothetical protein